MTLDMKSLFSGQGRVDRTAFWTTQFLLAIFTACLQATAMLLPSPVMMAMLLLPLIASWVVGILNLTRRLHDLGLSGWWMLLPAAIGIGVVGIAVAKFGRGSDGAIGSEGLAILAPLAFLLAVGALRGNPGPNRFGEPPTPASSAAT